MEKIGKLTEEQTKEFADLVVNNTGWEQPRTLYFIQIDDFHAVDNTGCIFQLVDGMDAAIVAEIPSALQYKGKSGIVYNYAEDQAEFEENSEDFDIFTRCTQQARYNFNKGM